MARQAPERYIHPSPLALGVAAFFVLLAAAPAFAAPSDTTAPSLTLYAPSEGAQLADDRPIVFGATERGAMVTVNGHLADVNIFDGTFEVRDLTLPGTGTSCLQPAVITVVATDAAGNFATVLRMVTANQCVTHPKLAAPLPDLTVALGQTDPAAFDLAKYFADDGGGDLLVFSTYLTAPGVTVSYASGKFSFAWGPGAAAGAYDMQLTAQDRNGETSDAAPLRLVVADTQNQAPVVALAAVPEPVPTGGYVHVTLTVSDPEADAFTVTAQGATAGIHTVDYSTVDHAPFTFLVGADAAALGGGPSYLQITAVDTHRAAASIEVPIVVYDASVGAGLALVVPAVPEVHLSDLPAGGDLYAEFSATRYVGVVYLNDPVLEQQDQHADRLNAEGTYFGAFVSLPRTPGTYTRYLWAGDPGLPENRFAFTWTVLPDPVAPTLDRIVPVTGSLEVGAGDAVSLQWVGNVPDPTNTEFTWTVDGEAASHASLFSDVKLAPGIHEIAVTAAGPGGSGSTSTTITVSPHAGPVAAPRSNPWPLWLGIAGLVAVGIFLGGTEVGIYFLLAGLVGAIVDRQNREKLLTHFVRGRIYQIIDDEPGIHLSELQRKAGVARGVCAYHLHALEKAGLIKTAREGMYLRFFATKVKIDAEAYTLASDDRAVLEAIEARPGMTEQQVAELLGKPGGHVARSVRALSQSGYVETHREGETLQLFARTQRGSAAPAAAGGL